MMLEYKLKPEKPRNSEATIKNMSWWYIIFPLPWIEIEIFSKISLFVTFS